MTTFNLRNKNRKFHYFGYCISVLVFVIIVVGVGLYVVKSPLIYDRITESSAEKVTEDVKNDITVTDSTNETKELIEDDSIVVVSTKLGKIRGKKSEVLGVKINTFMGIPYATPPTGKLRFRRTVPIDPWKKVIDGTKIPAPCLQPLYTQMLFPVKILNVNVSEDCLYLNVWSPQNKGNELLPVIIFIHGGMFTIGSVSVDEYDGRIISAYGNVVMVTMQYRLGIMGFLDLGTESISGNMGLWDQSMAIRWVKDNIESFGGDPNSITLMGQSVGAISIGFHLISPHTKDLFNRVILQSGSPMLLNPVYTKGFEVSEKFAENVGCVAEGTTIDDAPEIVSKCIDNLPLDKITDVQQEMVKNNPVPFFPTIPSDYSEVFPNEAINDNSNITISQNDFLMGFNLNDGNVILHLAYPERYTRTTVPEVTSLEEAQELLAQMTIDGGFSSSQAKTMASVLLKGNESTTPEYFADQMGTALGDLMMICPVIKVGDRLSKLRKNVYMYLFTQRTQNSVWGDWIGVSHHDEINIVFGHPLRYPNLYSGDDIDISKRIIKTWTHFARTGEMMSQLNNSWPLYTESNKTYIQMNANNASVGYRYHEQTCNLFEAIIEYFTRK